jgi:aminoglycoside/choline kinase family phosphotransferase
MTDARHAELQRFVACALPHVTLAIEPASADASFRSYWRVRNDAGVTAIVMDAPPQQEDVASWLEIGTRLRRAGLHAPEVFASDIERGFVLMEDLGTRTYLPELDGASVDTLYGDALAALLRMQRDVRADSLPLFDATRTIPEMELLGPWFIDRHLGFAAQCDDWDVIEQAFRLLAHSADAQPRRFMHRDYHSRNLLIAEPVAPSGFGSPQDQEPAPGVGPLLANPAIIDFQGAMLGPITYDLASLLRDCYIAWPIEQVDAWVEQYRRRLVAAGILAVDGARFRRWFDLIGLQRHLKVLGLFCRLWYRDGKAGYLGDLPRVFDYVVTVARLYPELLAFANLLQRAVGERDIAQARICAATTA